MRLDRTCIALIAAASVAISPAFAEKAKKQAVIVSVEGQTLHTRTQDGPLDIVVSGSTSIKETSGVAQRKTRSVKNLIPGLIVTVEGDLQGNSIAATEIRFKEGDWKAAVTTKAGTAAQFAELRQEIIDGQTYVVRGEATVYFATGSTAVAEQYKQQLRALAQQAPGAGNYRISVLGFADSHGDAAANEKLSMRRALTVSNFMRQTRPIEPGRVLAPSAMGEGTTAPGEAAPSSEDQARRVLVRLVTPKLDVTQ